MEKINLDLTINEKFEKLINENFEELIDKVNQLEKQNSILTDKINQLEKQNNILTDKVNRLEKQNNIFTDNAYFLYFVTNGDENKFKIGITNNIGSRLSSLQTSNHEPIKLITKVVGKKPEIVKLEKLLKKEMKDYNVNGEWFSLNYKDRQSLLDYLNKLNYNFYIDDSLINKNKKEIDKTNKENKEINEINKEEKIKLSELSTEEIIKLFYENGLKRLNNKLIFINSITNKASTDYDYFLEKIDIENDLKKKEINELFKKLNKEYISCFEQLKINHNYNNNDIQKMLDDLEIPSIDFLYGIKRKDLFKIYKEDYFGRKELVAFEKEICNINNCEFKMKKFTMKNKEKYVVNSVLCPKEKSKEKAIKEFYLKWSNFFDGKIKYKKMDVMSISELFKLMNNSNNDEFNEDVKHLC